MFFGDLDSFVEQLHGKEISYNNIGDIDAACRLIDDFEDTTFAIIKHNNACGIATRPTLKEAYLAALHAIMYLLLVAFWFAIVLLTKKLPKK